MTTSRKAYLKNDIPDAAIVEIEEASSWTQGQTKYIICLRTYPWTKAKVENWAFNLWYNYLIWTQRKTYLI